MATFDARHEDKARMEIAIRHYRPDDRDGVDRVALAAFAQYARDYDDWAGFSAGIKRTADLALDADLLVAESGGALVGAVVHVGPGKPRGAMYPNGWSVIRMLVVDPAWRGRGVGRRLVAACLQCALDARAPVVGLHTSPIMASALRLYLAIGFECDMELPPNRGVEYARYVLPGSEVRAAIAALNV